MDLILASTSSIRRQMLNAAGVEIQVAKPNVDEDLAKSKFRDASTIASELAAAKARSVVTSSWVIGSDSMLSVDGTLFSKPRNREEAAAHLEFFSGRTMVLTSAVALAHKGKLDWCHSDIARLEVRPLSDKFIRTYLDAEWPDVGYTVGVFRMEALGVQLFSSVQGDHFTILGMPLIPLLEALRERGLLLT